MLIVRFRNMMKGLVGRIFIFLMTLTLLGGYGFSSLIMNFFGKTTNGIAVVNGFEISKNSFNNAFYEYEQKIQALRSQYGAHADLYMQLMGMETDPKKAAFTAVLLQEIVSQFARNCNVHVSDSYVIQKISEPRFIQEHFGNQLPSDFLNQNGTINVYAFSQFIMTPEMKGLRDLFTQEIKSEFALSLLSSALYIPEFIIKDFYINKKIDKNFSIQTFSLDFFKNKIEKEEIEKQKLHDFYEKKSNIEKWYWIPEQRSGFAWEFASEDYGITLKESEIEEYYAKNKTTRYIKTPAQFKVREIIFNQVEAKGLDGLKKEALNIYNQVIENPKDFEKFAREYSQDKESASKGGLTDFFSRGSKDKSYEKAIIRLKNDGDVSQLIQLESGKGFVILQRVARKEATYSSLSEVRHLIEKTLKEQIFKKIFSKNTEKIVKDKDAANLELFAKDHSGKYIKIENAEKNKNQKFQRIFSMRNVGDYSAFIQDGKGYILVFEDKKSRHLPPFKEVSDQVVKDYISEKAHEAMVTASESARNQAFKENKLINSEGSKISKSGFIEHENHELIKKLIIEESYPEHFFSLTRIGDIVSNTTQDKSILVRLDELKEDNNFLENLKNKAEGSSYSLIHQLFASSCIASLFRNAKININESLISKKDIL